jgi:hypothetical protein
MRWQTYEHFDVSLYTVFTMTLSEVSIIVIIVIVLMQP